ncbi:family 16 glycoside hydrolase [Shewanella sp. MEBiC00475]|uniref:family 16 glycoside hydrolase n=1 Tax=Shewanella sp. MEBiC00475 TaxID=2575361 RepID=UPI00158658DD|nr:family 16 glycoside hydrolase [Shewanella sp. MEBiC00475]
MKKCWMLIFACLFLSMTSCNCQAEDSLVLSLIDESTQLVEDGFNQKNGAWQPYSGVWDFSDGRLTQTSTRDYSPVILRSDHQFRDLDLSVEFKPISGRIDASGGVIFRALDHENYYVVRANSLENNFRLYTVKNGVRRQIASAHTSPPILGQFHQIRIVAIGATIQAYLNGILLLDHHDNTFIRGFVGLWTKADSVTEFDQFKVIGVE